jgi:hypothetical protein
VNGALHDTKYTHNTLGNASETHHMSCVSFAGEKISIALYRVQQSKTNTDKDSNFQGWN